MYPVRNLPLWMNLRVLFRKLNPCEIALRVCREKKKEIGGRRREGAIVLINRRVRVFVFRRLPWTVVGRTI